jgi:AcrR family transcriptional regulator
MASSAEPSEVPGRRGLTRSDVARAALELVDRSGLEALTMRGLAAELGIGTMTLYGYVRTKAELVDAVLDAAAGELAPPQATGSWRERSRVHALAFRASLLRHPALVALRARQPLLRRSQLRVTEEVIGAMLAEGFTPAEAAASFRMVFTYVLGSVLVETGPEGLDTARDALAALPPESFPALRSISEEAVDVMAGSTQFEAGLDALLNGIEAAV